MKTRMLKIAKLVSSTVSLALVIGLGACRGAETVQPGEGRIKLMAAARVLSLPDSDESRFDPRTGVLLTKARIAILAVDIHEVDGGWSRFQIDPFELNLLDLDNQFLEVLGRATAPEGSYDQIRLITAESGDAAFEDGSDAQLIVPSGTKSGIKVYFDPAIEVLADHLSLAGIAFDVNKSFVFPDTGIVKFKPVLKVVSQTVVEIPTDTGDGDTAEPGTGSDTGTGTVELPTDPEDGDGTNFPPVFGV